MMSRKTFLIIIPFIAMTIGSIALFFPALFLESKGVTNNPAAAVWMSQVGILLLATGLILFLTRNTVDYNVLKSIFIGNILIQVGLLVIELIAYNKGIITEVSGIIPNCVFHVILTCGFVYYTLQINKEIRKNGIQQCI